MKNSYKIKANKIMTHAQFFEFCKRYNLDVQYIVENSFTLFLSKKILKFFLPYSTACAILQSDLKKENKNEKPKNF